VQFTIGQETQDKLRRLQALVRREIPDGDPGAIFDRAISLLLQKVERTKLGKAARPRSQRVIRPGTDSDAAEGLLPPRNVPNAVKRAVWPRDAGRCAYVSRQGRRCEERCYSGSPTFLTSAANRGSFRSGSNSGSTFRKASHSRRSS